MGGEILGEGASGVIYKSIWRKNAVAVKLFKGDITSDGSPLDEMQACIEAGNHPNLVPLLGKLSEAMDGKDGLVLSYIASDFSSLGAPPNFDTCTRDVYEKGITFTLPI